MKTLNYLKITSFGILIAVMTLVNVTPVFAEGKESTTNSSTIVDIAVSNDNFSILVEALAKADLVEALNAKGAFTVFAPTNEAFKNLFDALEVNGIRDLSKEQLIPILLYHVVDGKVMASAVSTGMVPTLNSDASLNVKKSKKGVTINKNSNVVTTDIEASNGVIHIIDAVLVPAAPAKKSHKKSGGCS